MPLQCSVFLTRHADILKQTNASGAAYLFQPDKLNAEYDLGDKTIQCGRRPDAFNCGSPGRCIHDSPSCRVPTHALVRQVLLLSSSSCNSSANRYMLVHWHR